MPSRYREVLTAMLRGQVTAEALYTDTVPFTEVLRNRASALPSTASSSAQPLPPQQPTAKPLKANGSPDPNAFRIGKPRAALKVPTKQQPSK